MKICTRCKIEKTLDHFGKKKTYQDGLQYWCKSCYRFYKKQYYDLNLNKSRQSRSLWKISNKNKVLIYQRSYLSKKYQTDKIFRIIKNQRNRLHEILVGPKPCSFSKSIGCSSIQLKSYLESKFQPGMTWDNYGEWEVDHIKPLSIFNLTNVIEFQEACSYKNLQPLWKKENREKSNKWEI